MATEPKPDKSVERGYPEETEAPPEQPASSTVPESGVDAEDDQQRGAVIESEEYADDEVSWLCPSSRFVAKPTPAKPMLTLLSL